jgi:hypothetical protein
MSLTSEQLNKLIETYAEQVVEGMDLDDLISFAYETIVENMSNMGEEAVLDNIEGYWDTDELASVIEDVGGNPADFDLKSEEVEFSQEDIDFLRNSVKKSDT